MEQRFSQILLLPMSSTNTSRFFLFLCDVLRAFRQAKLKVWGSIFVRPPSILKVPPYILFRILRSLYCLPKFCLPWFTMYHSHHRDKLSMVAAAYDLCLLSIENFFATSQWSSVSWGISCQHTDKIPIFGNNCSLTSRNHVPRTMSSTQKHHSPMADL